MPPIDFWSILNLAFWTLVIIGIFRLVLADDLPKSHRVWKSKPTDDDWLMDTYMPMDPDFDGDITK